MAGLEDRYEVRRRGDTEGRHDDCRYFVLDPQHDPIAREVLTSYAVRARLDGNDALHDDIWGWLDALAAQTSPASPDTEGGAEG